jgi:hypothetical protein
MRVLHDETNFGIGTLGREEPVVGKAAIREMFRREFTSAKMTCIPEVIHEAGNVAILE